MSDIGHNFKEVLGDSFSILEKLAPTIATAIGSPVAGTAAMFGLNLLSNAFGVPPHGLSNALSTSPDASDRLTKLESTFSDWFKANNGGARWPSSVEIKITWNDGITNTVQG